MLEPHLKRLIADILRGLKGYHDNFSITNNYQLDFVEGTRQKTNRQERRAALDELIARGLVTVEGRDRWRIAIENRYAFEQLARELGVVADSLPSLVFYDTETGKGLINGKSIALKKTNKKLFDLIFNSANTPVPRKVIWKAMGHRTNPKQNDTDSHELNQSISNLRKVCRTDASVIMVNDGIILKAQTFVYKNNRVEYRDITI